MTETTLKLKGTTRDVTTCDKCGREELAGTMILIAVNEAGEEYGDRMYFGVMCAAKTLRKSSAFVKTGAAAADKQRVQEAHEHATSAWLRRRADWLASAYGSAPYSQSAVNRFEREIEKAPNMNAHMRGEHCTVCG